MPGIVAARFRTVLFLAVLAAASGCVFTVPTDPNTYPAAADDFPALPSGTKVELVNGYAQSYFARMQGNQQADLQEFTQTAVDILGRTLAQKGVAVGAGGKRVVLEVNGVSWNPGFGFQRANVTLDATLDATKVSAWGEAAGVDASRNFSQAISHSVEALLKKPEVRDYLSRP